MKQKDVLIIGGIAAAAVAGFALAPKEVKDKVSDSLGGTVIDLSGLNIGGGSGDDGGGSGIGDVVGGIGRIIGGIGGGIGGGLGNVAETLDEGTGFDLNVFLKDFMTIFTGSGDGSSGNNPFDIFGDGEKIKPDGGGSFVEGVNAVGGLLKDALPFVIGTGGTVIAAGILPKVAGALMPAIRGTAAGVGSLASNTGAAAGGIIRTAGSGISGAARLAGSGLSAGARGLGGLAAAAGGSPLILGLAAAGAGVGAGLLFNQTPAGQALLANSADAGRRTANAVISGNANPIQSAIGALAGWNDVAKVNTAATDKAFSGSGFNTADVSAMIKNGMTPAEVVKVLNDDPSDRAPVKSSALRGR